MDPKELGARGEEAASAFLERHGHTIVERNWRYKRGEIDIISIDDSDIVFVEVKTRSGDEFGEPEEAVDKRKQSRLIKLADAYLNSAELTDVEARFDVIAIRYLGDDRALLRHHRDAFGQR